MFSIIDSRYRCNKPLIVTTNLKLDELKHPPDLAHARIYDPRRFPIFSYGSNKMRPHPVGGLTDFFHQRGRGLRCGLVPSILSRLCGTFGEDRAAFLDSLGDYDLLIIDDLGRLTAWGQ